MIPYWATRVWRIVEVPAFEVKINLLIMETGSDVYSLVPFRVCAIGRLAIDDIYQFPALSPTVMARFTHAGKLYTPQCILIPS